MPSAATINVLRKLEHARRGVSRFFYPFPTFLLAFSPAILSASAVYMAFPGYPGQDILAVSAFLGQLIGLRTIKALNLFGSTRKGIQSIANLNTYIWHADPTFKSTCSFSKFNRLMLALDPYPFLFGVEGRLEAFLESLDTQHQSILVKLGADIRDFPSINESLVTAKLGLDNLSLQWLSAKAAVKSELTLNEDNSNIYTRTIVHAADVFYKRNPHLLERNEATKFKKCVIS
ncbi:MAG: hypothetical protein U1E78_12105 [Gammaproteobacteria bacterium]